MPCHVTLDHCFFGTAPRRPAWRDQAGGGGGADGAAGGVGDPALEVLAVTTRFEEGQEPKFVTNVFYAAAPKDKT